MTIDKNIKKCEGQITEKDRHHFFYLKVCYS